MNTPMNLGEAIAEIHALNAVIDAYIAEVNKLREDLEVQEAHELSMKDKLEDAYKKLDYLQSIIDPARLIT